MSETGAIEILEAERSIQSVLTQYARGVDRCDDARVESYVVARHVTRAAPPGLVEVGGRYLDRFTRRDDRWRIARRVVVIDWSRISPIETGMPAGEYQQPDDPSYSKDA